MPFSSSTRDVSKSITSEKITGHTKVQAKEKKKRGGSSLLKTLKKILPCTRKAVKANFDLDGTSSMDFASPSMAVPHSPKRPGANAREVPSEYENIPALNCKIEDYQKLNDMMVRRERRRVILFPTTEAIPEPDSPHAAGDFSPAFVDAPRDVRQMSVDRKRIRRYALRHDELVGTTLVEDANKDVEDRVNNIENTPAGRDKMAVRGDDHRQQWGYVEAHSAIRQKLAEYGIVYCGAPLEHLSRSYGPNPDSLQVDLRFPRGYIKFVPEESMDPIEEVMEGFETPDTQPSTPAIQTPIVDSADDAAVVADGLVSPDEEQDEVVDRHSAGHCSTVSDEKQVEVVEALRQGNSVATSRSIVILARFVFPFFLPVP